MWCYIHRNLDVLFVQKIIKDFTLIHENEAFAVACKYWEVVKLLDCEDGIGRLKHLHSHGLMYFIAEEKKSYPRTTYDFVSYRNGVLIETFVVKKVVVLEEKEDVIRAYIDILYLRLVMVNRLINFLRPISVKM